MNETNGATSSTYTATLRNTAPPYYGYEETSSLEIRREANPTPGSDTMQTM